MNEKKPFEYTELKAMCMLCAAESALLVVDMKSHQFRDEIEGRMFIEKKVEDIINIRWNHPDKQIVKE